MKLAFLLGLLSVTMVMGKTAKLAEMAKTPEMAEDNREQRAAAERMDKEDAMEKKQFRGSYWGPPKRSVYLRCDVGWKSKTNKTCCEYETKEWCQRNGEFGKNWDKQEWGTFDDWANEQGRSALVCPQCGCDPRRQFFMIEKYVN